ncbi:conserved exported hypothetical protein [Tenacibaculum litopenaei]|uniref:hypothetical protein n=1 Tax=Tenacibaculum litopenaei TaxID=396016 RepID=UPI003894125B
MKSIKLAAMAAFALVCFACTSEEMETPVTPQQLTFKSDLQIKDASYFPEGLDYDHQNNVFLISSFYKGQIGKLNPVTGEFSVFIDSFELVAATGVYTDEARNRLIVGVADAGVSKKSFPDTAGKLASIAIYNLTTGKKERVISLSKIVPNAGSFANDIAVDAQGNIYVTSSLGPANVYKVAPDYSASLLVSIPKATTPPNTFGLNGIVYYEQTDELIVSHTNSDYLYVIPTKNNGTQYKSIIAPGSFIDGLELTDTGLLAAVSNSNAEVFVSTLSVLNGTVQNVKVVQEYSTATGSFPTTVTSVENQGLFVIESHLNELLSGNLNVDTFALVPLK